MSVQPAQIAEVRRTLVDAVRVCELLGLATGAQRQSAGITICCPVHAERTPSCSVTRGPDGTIRVRCFGCDWSADVLGLVAVARGLDVRRDFRAVLAAAAEVGGLHQLGAELKGVTPPVSRAAPLLPVPGPPREYPPADEVLSLWSAARAVQEVAACQAALAERGLQPTAELARALGDQQLPRWARYRGASWLESGHRVLLPAFDAEGALRSVRAWRTSHAGSTPKRLPPAGYRASELVLANGLGLAALRSPAEPLRLLIAEGEPDFLSLCQAYPGIAVLGVVSGSWSAAFAERIPFGSLVTIRTHHDPAGDRYAETIIKTLAERALIKRGNP